MQKVFVVLKNSDFIDGTGPMVLHLVFSDKADAVEYIENQCGIYGNVQHYIITSGNEECWNGYSIQEMTVMKSEDMAEFEKEKARALALSKLTDADKFALGL
jgi:hypothetical protein